MALWTPYAQDVALDLTKHAVDVKVERSSPLSASTVPECRPPLPLYTASQYYAPCAYQSAWYEVPSVSPDSTGSWTLSKQTAPSPPNSPEFYETTLSEDQEYQAFEEEALRMMAIKNGGTLLGSNPRMRRAVQANQTADDFYRKQRERNNNAAKQSRDRRKLREVRQQLQVQYLTKKVADLKAKLAGRYCERCRQICELNIYCSTLDGLASVEQ